MKLSVGVAMIMFKSRTDGAVLGLLELGMSLLKQKYYGEQYKTNDCSHWLQKHLSSCTHNIHIPGVSIKIS